MSTIDLTDAVTAAAKRYHSDYQDRLRKARAKAGEEHDDYPTWDQLNILAQNNYREAVLPTVYAAHRHIAVQAWQEGHDAPRNYVVDTTYGGDIDVLPGPPAPNPYDPTRVTTF